MLSQAYLPHVLATEQQLNRLNVSLFTPSLLFSKVAFFLSPGAFKHTLPPLSRLKTPISQARRIMDYPYLLHNSNRVIYGHIILARMDIQIKALSKVCTKFVFQPPTSFQTVRSEEHTSELQSH